MITSSDNIEMLSNAYNNDSNKQGHVRIGPSIQITLEPIGFEGNIQYAVRNFTYEKFIIKIHINFQKKMFSSFVFLSSCLFFSPFDSFSISSSLFILDFLSFFFSHLNVFFSLSFPLYCSLFCPFLSL